MTKNPKLVVLFQQMADLTRPKCGTECYAIGPTRCCEKMYCDMAKRYAKEDYGIDLQPTGHPTVPYMGENGCTVAPHLRPLCTLHTCKINSMGFTKDPEWDRQYFELREKINEAEFDD